MDNRRGKYTIDELAELDGCPCGVCSSQDDESELLDRQKLNEACMSEVEGEI